MFKCVKLNTLYDREMKVFYVTQVFKQGINMKTMSHHYTLAFIVRLSRRVCQDRNCH